MRYWCTNAVAHDDEAPSSYPKVEDYAHDGGVYDKQARTIWSDGLATNVKDCYSLA